MEIIDYPNYLIYKDGRVWSKKRQGCKEGYLKPQMKKTGYWFVNLYNNGKEKHYLIHRLIALHYIPNPENKPCIDHIDGNKLNNDINNLRWVTQQQNTNAFRSKQSNNKSGIKNVHYNKRDKVWVYKKTYFGDTFRKQNKNKQYILWIKFVDYLLFH